jgi:hypothetical protein
MVGVWNNGIFTLLYWGSLEIWVTGIEISRTPSKSFMFLKSFVCVDRVWAFSKGLLQEPLQVWIPRHLVVEARVSQTSRRYVQP